MSDNLTSKEKFSLIKRAKSFTHAGRGLWVFVRSTHNAWIHLVVLAVAVFLGVYFGITVVEWMILVLAGGFVLAAEAFNTAIEINRTYANEYNSRRTRKIRRAVLIVR